MVDIDETVRKIADDTNSYARDQKIELEANECVLLDAGSAGLLNERGVAEFEKVVAEIYQTDQWIVEPGQGREPKSLPPMSAIDETMQQQANEIGFHPLTIDPTKQLLVICALKGVLNERGSVEFAKFHAQVTAYNSGHSGHSDTSITREYRPTKPRSSHER